MGLTVFCEVLITFQAQVQTSAMKFFKGLECLLLNKQSIYKQLYSFFFPPFTCSFSIHQPWLLLHFALYILLPSSTVCVELLPCLTFCLPSSSCAMNNCYSMPWGFPSPICLKSLACCYLHWVTSVARKLCQILILQFSLKRKSKSFPFSSLSSLCVSLVLCSTYHWNGLPVSLIPHLNLKSCLQKEKEISP